jgi:hypothetical protein
MDSYEYRLIERTCVALRAVRAAVRVSAHGSVCAVRAAMCDDSVLGSVWHSACRSVRLSGSAAVCSSAAVCGSAALHGSARQCGNVQQNAAECGSVRQCEAVYGSVRQYGSVCVAVRLGSAAKCSSSACGSARAAVCGSLWQCLAVRTVVSGSGLYVYIYTHKAHNIHITYWYVLKGTVLGTEPNIPRKTILADDE